MLDYGEGTGIAIKGKTLTFNGINKKNGKRVTIKGLESLFTVGEASVISLNDLIIDGFKNIAIRLSGNSTLNANNCQFSNNYEPLSSKVNNGGVIRVSGSNAFFEACKKVKDFFDTLKLPKRGAFLFIFCLSCFFEKFLIPQKQMRCFLWRRCRLCLWRFGIAC